MIFIILRNILIVLLLGLAEQSTVCSEDRGEAVPPCVLAPPRARSRRQKTSPGQGILLLLTMWLS